MVLAKIEMSLSEPSVRAALRDAQKMHRLAAGLYQLPRQEAELVYRVQLQGQKVNLYLYAGQPIDRSRLLPGMRLAGERELSDWLVSMREGQLWGFDLLTMPFRKVADGESANSRRRVLRTPEERLAWLNRKAEQNGFAILEARESAGEKESAVHPLEKGGRLYLDSYRYSGTLQIKDLERFKRALRNGIGPGKAYGLGMLLLKNDVPHARGDEPQLKNAVTNPGELAPRVWG